MTRQGNWQRVSVCLNCPGGGGRIEAIVLLVWEGYPEEGFRQ